ncbi:MAG: ATP-binding cassette domain-containing protein [Chitinophagaceae bacterium]|nr:ATP-binding cassette domain-containing protein [Chitinophagaceae bacterium]
MPLQLTNLLPTYFDASRKNGSEIWGKEHRFDAGQYIKIIAPSGSGKSSLMNFLYGMRTTFSGDIRYNNKSILQNSDEDWAVIRRETVSIVFQDLRLFPQQSVLDNIEIKRQLQPYHPSEKMKEMAERLGIADKLTSKCGNCSYGEQQRTAIIRAMMQPFQFLLLDEPFSHLDDANAQKAMGLMMEEAQARNACIILADLERLDHYPYTQLYHL